MVTAVVESSHDHNLWYCEVLDSGFTALQGACDVSPLLGDVDTVASPRLRGSVDIIVSPPGGCDTNTSSFVGSGDAFISPPVTGGDVIVLSPQEDDDSNVSPLAKDGDITPSP